MLKLYLVLNLKCSTQVYVIIDNQIKTCWFLEFCNYAMILSATGIGVSVLSTNKHAPLLSLVIKRREGVGQGDQGLNLCIFHAFSHGFSPDLVGRGLPKWELSSNKKHKVRLWYPSHF